MTTQDSNIEWLWHRTVQHHSGRDDASGLVEELERDGKLGFGLMALDELEEVDLGEGST
jgi:hypothetical protein